jgi:hypothetical protein
VLNKVALSVQVNMNLREIYGAPTRVAAEAAIDAFADKYVAKYNKAVAPSAHVKPDRERIRDSASSNRADERRTISEDRQTHGVQTCQRRRKNMAAIERREPVAKGRSRRQIQKRN